jgi:hypothetical protein
MTVLGPKVANLLVQERRLAIGNRPEAIKSFEFYVNWFDYVPKNIVSALRAAVQKYNLAESITEGSKALRKLEPHLDRLEINYLRSELMYSLKAILGLHLEAKFGSWPESMYAKNHLTKYISNLNEIVKRTASLAENPDKRKVREIVSFLIG